MNKGAGVKSFYLNERFSPGTLTHLLTYCYSASSERRSG